MRGRDSVVWLRRFSHGFNCDCQHHLVAVHSMILGVRRMIMGHTTQEGINFVCEDKDIMIDVGLSKRCSNGLPQVIDRD
ncbi:hypothetical protein KSP40_PGU018508 [Platanthera guangdongensis]|uniref:Uncharacterized protein n=1 Tax=Platanthera guangdongensis TaxID=2320717 RepID=A0ABR2M3Y4_9ASPA